MKFSTGYGIGAAIGVLTMAASYAQAEVPSVGDAQSQMAGSAVPTRQSSTAAQSRAATPAPAQSAGSFNDTEIAQFAVAAKAVQDIQADASIAATEK